jgi:hypothetical protein
MKRITELLERLNKGKYDLHKFQICQDGSGDIVGLSDEDVVCEFNDYKDMCRKLDKLEASLTDTNYNDWTL